MKAETLIAEIEKFYAQFVVENGLFEMARQGRVDAPLLQRYLVGIEHVTKNTIPTLRKGALIARRQGDKKLAEYYAHKIGEEVGHDAWAREDQDAIAAAYSLQNDKNLGSAVRRFVDEQRKIVDEDPRLYLAYMLFTEYFTVLAVPDWVKLLEERCSLPARFMTVLTKHAELDKGHVGECIEEFNALMDGYQNGERLMGHLYHCFQLYMDFCNEIAEGAENVEDLKRSA